MSRAKDRLAEFFPQAPSVLQQKRNTSSSDRKASDSRSLLHQPDSSLSGGAKASSKQRLDGHANANTTIDSRSTPHEEDESHRVSPGDVLNTVGSASSLSSAASSVFSNNLAANAYNASISSMHALTPLTNTESSPPGKMLSPRSAKRTYDQMQNGATTSPYLAPAADSRGVSRTITPVQTPPENTLQARPGPGEVKGLKITLDPLTDPKLTSKERKILKPTYREFGAEVRSTSMRVYLLT
jgi:histone-lysine N-methyltransferase SETD1